MNSKEQDFTKVDIKNYPNLVNYKIGLEDEAKAAAVLLGYNYNSSEWYIRSYKILNKNYSIPKIEKNEKEAGLIKRTIKKMLLINDE